MIKGQEIKYVGNETAWYGKTGVFVNFTNKTKTKCRFELDGRGCTGLVSDLESLESHPLLNHGPYKSKRGQHNFGGLV